MEDRQSLDLPSPPPWGQWGGDGRVHTGVSTCEGQSVTPSIAPHHLPLYFTVVAHLLARPASQLAPASDLQLLSAWSLAPTLLHGSWGSELHSSSL